MALSDAVAFAVAAWDLDEASGTRVDQVGANDLTDNNTVASAAGMFGNAADCELSNSEYLSITDNADLSVGDIDFMIRVWVKAESLGGGDFSIVGKGGSNDLSYNLDYNGASTRFRFRVSSAAGFTNLTSVSANNFGAPSTGTWYLLHAWHDAANNQIGIAVNAGTADTAAYSNGSYNDGGDFNVGAFPFYGNYFDGLIDDVVILKNYILDATERSEDYNSGTGVAFADWDAGATTTVRLLGLLGVGV